jgi:dissimilatory sulfite reductase (desulfoviridin) alpha/beta subunit
MQWTPEAEDAIKKVPFFVRGRVRARVEKEAAEAGRSVVTLPDVQATKRRYLNRMSSDIKGYQLDACFGPTGCPNRTIDSESLIRKLEAVLKNAGLLDFLKKQVDGDLKFHHEFRITAAECPNACSQPQIKDIGIIGACRPMVSDEPCSDCGACTLGCPDDAVKMDGTSGKPLIDGSTCLQCGKCISACPTGTIAWAAKGYKILLGGKLGRHPRLARQLPGIFSEEEVVQIVAACIDFYKERSTGGKRFAEIFQPIDFENFSARFGKIEFEKNS